ncbi:hypothetical protein [Pseudomonas sp. BN515]|uniref:hypothetical protein n=1 Tax=Pseudomonas sp. BN515 TaxID=2567892 RepID=UPI002457D669|nr:hypothetical protein [Pseudomonas sp. BN515]MDH4873015.1 hypothetical protein [Pseudomonas sp. BN515]
MSDLQILFPKPEVVMVGRRPVHILPVKLRHFEQFGEASIQLLAMLGNFSAEEIYAYAKRSGALGLVLRECTSLSWWSLRRLPAPAAVQLMIYVVRVNSSFFGQALVAARSALDGPTPPSN